MAAVAQHPQPKAMSADELARSLRAHLERRGVLRGLTARLRRDITLEVRGQRGDGPQPSSSQQRLRDSVIAEALRTQHTGNAYAVFVPESSLGEERACLDSSELAEAVGPYASTALDKLIGRATTKTVDVETNTTIRPAGETLGDRLESVRRKFRALSKEKENIENEATLEAEATAAAIESAEAIVKAKRDADVEADYKRLHARYRDELDALSRNVRAVLQRESESREDAQSAAADRARADAARAEARKHEAQAERLQAQFAAAVADANAARSEVLHLREALVLQREDAASRARVQLAQAEFAAAERRKTEDERARASELADDLAGDSQVQLEPSRAGQLSSSEEAIGRRAAAAFRLAGRNRREAVSTTVVFEAPKDPVRALDAALAAGDAAERMRAQACAQLDAEVASNEELRSELRALRNLVDQSRGALDALAREPPSAFSRVHVVAKPPPPPPSRSVIEAGPPRFQLVDTRDLYASRRRAVPDDDDDGELAALQERRAKAIARAKADAEAAEAEAEASLRRREAALVARERAAAAAVYVSPPVAAAPPPTTVYVAPPAAPMPVPAAPVADAPPAAAPPVIAAPAPVPPVEPVAAAPPVPASPPVAAPPPIATEPPPVSFQKLTEPVALGDTFRSHVPEPDEAVVSPPEKPAKPPPEDRSPRSPRSPRVRGGMLDDDDESSDGEPEAPAISPRTAARREKARLAADREEAEYVATKALADAEARRLDREQNAEKYAAEDAARRVSEAEAKIGEADVLRLRKVYEEACDADGRLPVPNLLTAFAKLTGTKPQWEEGVALAGGPGAVVASADAFVLLASALDPAQYTPPAETDADAIFRRVMEQRKAARPQAPPSRSPSRSDTRSDSQSVSDVALDAADSPRASQASPRASDAGSDFWG